MPPTRLGSEPLLRTLRWVSLVCSAALLPSSSYIQTQRSSSLKDYGHPPQAKMEMRHPPQAKMEMRIRVIPLPAPTPDFLTKVRSGPGKPKKGQFMNFSQGHSGTKVRDVNRPCFPKEKPPEFTEKWAKFMRTLRFGPFFSLVCRGDFLTKDFCKDQSSNGNSCE